MLTFNLNEAPPTPDELKKASINFVRTDAILGLLGASGFVVCMSLVVALYFGLNVNPSTKNHIPWFLGMAFWTYPLMFKLFAKFDNSTQAIDLKTISKPDCIEIEKGMEQPLIANYCAQVGAQGRELVAGEYDAIVKQIQLKEAESLRAQTEVKSAAACKRVYGLTPSLAPTNQK